MTNKPLNQIVIMVDTQLTVKITCKVSLREWI